MLTSLSLFSKAYATGLFLDGEDKKRVYFLTKSMSKSKYSINKAIYLSWVDYFDGGGEGSNNSFQVSLLAFLLHLSKLT